MDSYVPDTPKPARQPTGLGPNPFYRQLSFGINNNADVDSCAGALLLDSTGGALPTREDVPSKAHDEVDLSRFSFSSPQGTGLAIRHGPDRHNGKNRPKQSKFNYFSSLTQRFQPSPETDCSKAPNHASENAPDSGLGQERHGFLNIQSQRGGVNNNHAGNCLDLSSNGTNDSISTKFNVLNEKVQAQTQEITELRFSLNDADVAAAALEAEKRRLKRRNDDLEQKLRESQSKAAKLEEETKQLQGELQRSTSEQNALRHDISSISERAKSDQNRLADAQNALQEAHAKLETTRFEMQRDMEAAMTLNRANMEAANQKIKNLALDIENREAELQYQKEANSRLSKQLDDIPDRNFQAMSACVKKIFERIDKSQNDTFINNKTVSEEQKTLMTQVDVHIEDVLAASRKHQVLLSEFQEKIDLLDTGVSKIITAIETDRSDTTSCLKETLNHGLQGLHHDIGEWQTKILQKLDNKIYERDVLTNICKNQDKDSKHLSNILSEQAQALNEQLQLTRGLHSRLQTMEDSHRKDPNTTALIELLRAEKLALETKVRDQEAQIMRLEAVNKQKMDALVEAGDKFAQEVQHLGAMYQQREEEYRRVQDRVSELAQRETRLYLDESKQETQRELQQERAKRQELERHLRQAKEEASVLEESYRRCGQSLDGLQEELAVTRLRAQGVAEHLEEKMRALEQERDAGRTVTARLKALLADREMDYRNLKNSMAVYDEKVGILMEHLRGWAQDYRHIGTIRSRLEMLGQIDQSCAATARIREAEQIDSVLAHLRQYCARGGHTAARDDPVGHTDLKRSHLPSSETSDGTHEKRVADLAAYLDLDTDQAGQDACNPGAMGAVLQTPDAGAVPIDNQSPRAPPILRERRTRRRTVLQQQPDAATILSDSPQTSSPMVQRAQRAGSQKRRHADLEANSQASAAERHMKRKQQPGGSYSVLAHNLATTQDAACGSQDACGADESTSPSVTVKSEKEQ